ncbi:MAG TPA: hypothetical protein VGF30_10920 [Bacteroidia bacterium]
MKNKLFRYINKVFLNKKVATFIICLVISSFLWFVNALNRNYTKTIAVPVRYLNLPKNKILSVELPKQIQAEVKTSGTKLMFIEMNLDKTIIEINAANFLNRNDKRTVAINTALTVGSFSKVFNTEVELIKVKPDSIYFNFGKSYQKVVPVKPTILINFDPFYNYKNKVKITPSFVTLFGDSALLSSIDSINTDKIVLNDFNNNISQTAKLSIPEELEQRVGVSTDEVLLEINVDKFTEKTIEVPIEAINVPVNLQLKTFPDKVTLKVQVPMSDFEKLDPSYFKVVVDYKDYQVNKNKLNLKEIKAPANIKITKISPDKVEYLLRKL